MNTMFHLLSFLGIAAVINPSAEQAVVRDDISVYLPAAEEIEGWNPVNTPRVFEGEELYDLIDGGASIFYEYGFKQVVTQTYENADGQSIDLEVYEMRDPAAAYGMYTISAGVVGDNIDIGNEGVLADYYVYFWKGEFFVTLIASAADERPSTDLMAIASCVDRKILNKGSRPSLSTLMMIEGESPARVYYIRGTLALANIYYFAFDDIFGLTEGVVGEFEDFKCYIFKYDDIDESRRWFESARDAMKEDTRYTDFQADDNECSMIDESGAVVHLKNHLSYIIGYTGDVNSEPATILYKIENNFR